MAQRIGSTRVITPVQPGIIDFAYTDKWSAFDRGSSQQEIPGIGRARCAATVKSFELAAQAGLQTHFIKQVNDTTVRVNEFMIPGQPLVSGGAGGRMLAVEWIWRARAEGSLLVRIESGEICPESLGFARGTVVQKGMKLPVMRHEFTTKFEPVDRHITEDEAMTLARITHREMQLARKLITDAVGVSNHCYYRAGFICPDGKLELGMYGNGRLTIVDVFGTPDENRIVEEKTGELYSKDLIRNYLKSLPWKQELDHAKARYPNDKAKWPEYPELPLWLVHQVSERYQEVAERYCAV